MTLLVGSDIAKHVLDITGAEAGRKFMLRFKRPERNDPISIFARKITKEVEADDIRRVADRLKVGSATFTPEDGKPVKIVLKDFTFDPDPELAGQEEPSPEVVSSVMENLFQFEFDKQFTTNLETGKDLTCEELLQKLTGFKRMVCGFVCNEATVEAVRAAVGKIESDAKTPRGGIPVYVKPGQVDACRAFYDPKALAEYLKE